MLSMDCLDTPGIFRVPGDVDLVHDLQRRIDQGRYTLKGLLSTPSAPQGGPTVDVFVLASALKLWLRELKDSIFPERMYNDCLKASESPARVVELCMRLDTIHLRVVCYVVAFLQVSRRAGGGRSRRPVL